MVIGNVSPLLQFEVKKEDQMQLKTIDHKVLTERDCRYEITQRPGMTSELVRRNSNEFVFQTIIRNYATLVPRY